MIKVTVSILAALFIGCSAWSDESPKLTAKGIQLDFGLGGKIVFNYPKFKPTSGKTIKPQIALEGNKATLRYADQENTPEVIIAQDANKFVCTITGKGAAGILEWESILPIMWHKEGSFEIPAGKAAQKFPQLYTKEKTTLGNGSARSIVLISGNRVTVTSTPGCYWQLQDNRAWKWNAYALFIHWQVPAKQKTETRTLEFASVVPEKVAIQVDRFGQPATLEFPGKIHAESELAADLAADRDYYGKMTPPERDKFGGLKEITLESTGFFRLAKWQGRDILVTPEGHPIYHLAVCAVGPCDDYTYTKGREAIYAWLPDRKDPLLGSAWMPNGESFSFYQANYIRKTGKPFSATEWRADIHNRLKKLGFNAQGAFAGSLKDGVKNQFAITMMLPLQPWKITGPMGELADPFDSRAVAKIDQLFAPLAADANNPFIVGYFIQNERFYSEVPRKIASLDEKSAAKREFIRDLNKQYSSIDKFNTAWGTSLADFDEAVKHPLPVKTEAAWQDVANFSAKYFDAYFKLIHDTFRKYDKNHLLLGDRFLPAETNHSGLVEACGRYNDIVSINYYAQVIDPSFLKKIHERSGRPLLLSEWSFGTAEQGLSGGCINVKDQKERGKAYRNYVEQTAHMPFVVGTQFFANHDQALTGRFFQYYNGENMNIGLFNVADRPFPDFHDAIRETNYTIYDVVTGKRPAYAWSSLSGKTKEPRFIKIPHAAVGHKVDAIRSPWPGRPSERIGKAELLLGRNAGNVNADFWLCWDEKNLYLFIDVNDPTPCKGATKGENFWNGDAVELFLATEAIDQPGNLRFSDRQLMISAKPGAGAYWAKQTQQPPVEVCVLRFANGKGYSLEAAIPWNALGITKPAKGTKLRFDLALDNSDAEKRTEQFVWSGTIYNSTERTLWGMATLVD